ncbi:MAG: DUF2182 domain-containing protein [Povalibacter sp.]
MNDGSAIEELLRRDRGIALAGLTLLCALAWLYILMGVGVGMSAWEMTSLSLFPHQLGGDHATAMVATQREAWPLGGWIVMIAMWWIMMIAMMAPSAAPAILLYAKVNRQTQAKNSIDNEIARIGAFAGGYLSVWLAFSFVITVFQWTLERTGLVSAMMMGSQSRWLSSAVLLAAGLYQLSPPKQACLSHCRAPASFLARHYRPHATGAFRLGALHGSYCVGCCWILMTLLFVGGAMNLVWIAAITTMVLLEKVLRAGRWVSRAAGVALIAWSIATVLV